MTDQNDQSRVEDSKPASQANNENQGESALTPEAQEWAKLSGSAKTRFSRLANKVKELENQMAQVKSEPKYQPPLPPEYYATPKGEDSKLTEEERVAIERLRKKGLTTIDDLNNTKAEIQNEFQSMKDNMILDAEYARLEGLYDGSDGRPSFDRGEIERHMKSTGIYNPEKAYKDLYEEELLAWRLENDKSFRRIEPEKKPYTEQPRSRASTADEPLSIDSIRERLQQKDGREWWEEIGRASCRERV